MLNILHYMFKVAQQRDNKKNETKINYTDKWYLLGFLTGILVCKLVLLFMLKFLVAYENKFHIKIAKELITKNESIRDKKVTASQAYQIEKMQENGKSY